MLGVSIQRQHCEGRDVKEPSVRTKYIVGSGIDMITTQSHVTGMQQGRIVGGRKHRLSQPLPVCKMMSTSQR